jgi:hypothetical protein
MVYLKKGGWKTVLLALELSHPESYSHSWAFSFVYDSLHLFLANYKCLLLSDG